MTPQEQQAIDIFLAKPKSEYRSGGCACMGRSMIAGFEVKEQPYSLEVKDNTQRSKFIIQVHKRFDVSMAQAKEMVDNKNVGFDNSYICKNFKEDLDEAGIKTEVVKKPSGEYPECSCRMDNVVEVEGVYYRIEKDKNNQLKAVILGPVGGPYQNLDWLNI